LLTRIPTMLLHKLPPGWFTRLLCTHTHAPCAGFEVYLLAVLQFVIYFNSL